MKIAVKICTFRMSENDLGIVNHLSELNALTTPSSSISGTFQSSDAATATTTKAIKKRTRRSSSGICIKGSIYEQAMNYNNNSLQHQHHRSLSSLESSFSPFTSVLPSLATFRRASSAPSLPRSLPSLGKRSQTNPMVRRASSSPSPPSVPGSSQVSTTNIPSDSFLSLSRDAATSKLSFNKCALLADAYFYPKKKLTTETLFEGTSPNSHENPNLNPRLNASVNTSKPAWWGYIPKTTDHVPMMLAAKWLLDLNETLREASS